jgi:hypothetical protein
VRNTFLAAAAAVLAAAALAACSNASSSAAHVAASAAAAPAVSALPVYPGAAEGTPPGSSGSPPPGIHAYSTSAPAASVRDWYGKHLKGAHLRSSSARGGVFVVGTAPNATVVMVAAQGGKTWILTGPPSFLL